MKVVGIWKDGDVRITHTLVVDAQNIEQAREALETKYPEWKLLAIRSVTK
ncbi:MAG: hypothetical protein Q6356_008905 [Candidatus Wukongarchaeota archaeon]|nr:hypothetical protein [Candidatus Wukongarchaeota archaeon]